MKKLAALGLVLVLFALASPALAGPFSSCEWIQGTSCSYGAPPRTCRDVCGYQYTCHCTYWGGQYYWSCPYTC